MRALFVTTHTNDIRNVVDAWDSISVDPAERFIFNYERRPLDGFILDTVRRIVPEVIFYIGGCDGIGLPSTRTFRRLRRIAPIINLIPDAGDPPWHDLIKKYRNEDCFDLYVGLDGCPDSPVDLVTVTPVNWKLFDTEVERDIRCGFSGGLGGKRDDILKALESLCFVRVRANNYVDHVSFLQRCHMILNTAWTGSGLYYHVKGRVIEVGWAGSALLEHSYAPTKHWFPTDAYFSYSSSDEAAEIIVSSSEDDVVKRALLMAKITRERYHPAMIYGEILKRMTL